jgi:hypothetical protein
MQTSRFSNRRATHPKAEVATRQRARVQRVFHGSEAVASIHLFFRAIAVKLPHFSAGGIA